MPTLKNIACGRLDKPSKNSGKKARRRKRMAEIAKLKKRAADAAELQRQYEMCSSDVVNIICRQIDDNANCSHDYDSPVPPIPEIKSLWYYAVMYGCHRIIKSYPNTAAPQHECDLYDSLNPCNIQDLLAFAVERNEIECMKALIARGAKPCRGNLQKLSNRVRGHYAEQQKIEASMQKYEASLRAEWQSYITECDRDNVPEDIRCPLQSFRSMDEEQFYSSDDYYELSAAESRRRDARVNRWKPKNRHMFPPLCTVMSIAAAEVLLEDGADPFESVLEFAYDTNRDICDLVSSKRTVFDYMLDSGRRDIHKYIYEYTRTHILTRKQNVLKLVMLADSRRHSEKPHAIRFDDTHIARRISAMVGGISRAEMDRNLNIVRMSYDRDAANRPDPIHWPIFRNVDGFTLKFDPDAQQYDRHVTITAGTYSNEWLNYCKETIDYDQYWKLPLHQRHLYHTHPYDTSKRTKNALVNRLPRLNRKFGRPDMVIIMRFKYYDQCADDHSNDRESNFNVDVEMRSMVATLGLTHMLISVEDQVDMTPVRDHTGQIVAYTIEPSTGREIFNAHSQEENLLLDMKCFGRYDLLYPLDS